MPKYSLEVPEVMESIMRPAVMAVVREFMAGIGIPTDTPIQFIDKGGSAPQSGSTLTANTNESVRLSRTNKFIIDVIEDYPEDMAQSAVVLRPEDPVFFKDDALQVYLKPAYQQVEYRINVKYRTEDKTTAELWQNRMKRKIGRGKDDDLHDVQYHFPIPPVFIIMLCEIHRMREAVAPYGETLGDWLKACFTERFTTISDQAGKNPTLVIRENQTNIIGWYDFGKSPPTPEKETDTGAYSVSFQYVFRLDKPEAVVIQYPLMIHNQLMARKFREDGKPFELEDIIRAPNLSQYEFEKIAKQYPPTWAARPGIAIPHYDDWLPSIEIPGTQSIVRLLLQVDPLNPTHLVNLESLGNWEFKDYAIAYMRECAQFMCVPRESVYSLTLHRNWNMMDQSKIQVITNQGGIDLLYEDDLELREWYHLHVSMLFDLSQLTDRALALLFKHGQFAIELMKVIYPDMDQDYLDSLLRGDGSVSILPYRQLIEQVSLRRYQDRAPGRWQWGLVGTFVIQTHRR
jgi:hypothetical protein